jgi:Na+-driven multidrug efflux pump
LLKFGLSKHFFNLGPAGVAIASFAVMVSILAIGYWLIFKNPSTTVKRQALMKA